MTAVLVWSITAISIAGIIFRPRQWPEAIWACLGALLLLLLRLVSPSEALSATARGTDVYLFLAGMMLLADLARHEGVFDWLATHAVSAARGSTSRLFALIYSVGIAVTVFLSNDATAVVLTPAVYAAIKRARVDALPYLFACAFIANAASFVLPISNPANLVVYGKNLPPLLPWLRVFALPSLLSIAATFAALRWRCAKALVGNIGPVGAPVELSNSGRRAAWGIAATAIVLIAASATGQRLGMPTLLAAAVAMLAANAKSSKEIIREVSWSVLPFVAGLFVLVEGLTKVGASQDAAEAIDRLALLPAWAGTLAASFGVTAVSNVVNNLPSGLMTGRALELTQASSRIRDALLIGVDLGPNLSVTGSLATLLWLIALRREGVHISGWTFLKTGVFVMTPALILATIGLLFTAQTHTG
jgi:arsenical pump membrane protein